MPFTSLEACTTRMYDDLVDFCCTVKSKGSVSARRMPEQDVNPTLRGRYLNFGNACKYTLKAGRNYKRRLQRLMTAEGWTFTQRDFVVQRSQVIIADAEDCMCGNVVIENYVPLTTLEVHEKLVVDYVNDIRRGYCRMNEFKAQIENRPWGLDSATDAAEIAYSTVIDIQASIRIALECISGVYYRIETDPAVRREKTVKVIRKRGKDFGFKQDLCATCNEVTV